MSDMTVLQYHRGIEEVTEEIREETSQFLRSAIRIGRLLFEAKSMVAPGDWGKYIEEKLPFSHSWANNYMKLYKEYGSEQLSVFGNSQAIMNLRPTQALELLRLPEEQREEFVQTHDVENLSTRQLHQEIQEELDKALEKQEELEKELADANTDMDALREDLEAAEETARKAQEEITRLEGEVERHRQERDAECAKVEKLQPKLEKAKANEKAAKEQLKKLQENPEIPEAVMEEMRQQVAADAAKQATEELQKKLDEAVAKADAAQQAAKEAEEKLVAAQKAARLSNPLAVAFRVKFDKLQQEFTAMLDDLMEMRKEDPDLAAGMTKGVRALLDLWQQNLEG